MNLPTWSDLNSESIVPPLGTRKAPDLGPVGLMVSCKPDVRLIKAQMVQPKVVDFFNNTLMTSKDGYKGICVAGPFMGAPYGAMLLESLISRGVNKIVAVGWCGAIDEHLKVGDLILVQNAIVDEGTSCNYVELDVNLPCSKPDLKLTDQLENFFIKRNRESADTHSKDDKKTFQSNQISRQTIWTTDAIYRETPKKVTHFKNLGAKAVEMECSALFSVSRFRNVNIAAVLVVSDSLALKDWEPGFRNNQFKQGRKLACETVFEFVKQLGEDE